MSVHFHYYEIKGGFDYRLQKNVKLTLGAGTYQTYKEGGDFVLPKNNNEFRVWPQITLNQNIKRLPWGNFISIYEWMTIHSVNSLQYACAEIK